MEFLDPQKRKAHLIRLFIGYILVGTALILTTIILLYQAYGFGIRNGEVIQNGLIFVSSNPRPADIYVNGKKNDKTTNTRLLLQAGQYTFRLEREGYRTWRRSITIEGGSVARFDYPFLFPAKLETAIVKQYKVKPLVATQSLNKDWLMVQDSAAAFNEFDLFDLSDIKKPVTTAALPVGLFAYTTGTHIWEEVEWASDNRHVLLRHTTSDAAGASEYILADREKPEESINVTRVLAAGQSKIELLDRKYDKFVVFDQQAKTVSTATLEQPTAKPLLTDILAFKSYGDDVFLYVTDKDVEAGKVAVGLREGSRTYNIRQVAVADKYMIDLTKYDTAWYVVAGSPAENKTYVYRDPAHMLRSKPKNPLVPVQVLKAPAAQYVAFSDNSRFVVAQGGQQFAVYDAETDKGYTYSTKVSMDAAQQHVTWMDGHRLMFVGSGKTYVFEFDYANRETLAAADAAYVPLFDNKYVNMYSIAAQSVKAADGTETAGYAFTRTALRTKADQ
ncbi:MAG TPA: PEGA domain-containing protein [Candidatus Saccharimonadales bacterium]